MTNITRTTAPLITPAMSEMWLVLVFFKAVSLLASTKIRSNQQYLEGNNKRKHTLYK